MSLVEEQDRTKTTVKKLEEEVEELYGQKMFLEGCVDFPLEESTAEERKEVEEDYEAIKEEHNEAVATLERTKLKLGAITYKIMTFQGKDVGRHMAKGIRIESAGEQNGHDVFLLRKSRGKLSIDDIAEFLQQEKQGVYHGNYVIFVNATESAMGGAGWFDEERKGDLVEVVRINGDEHCPVCAKMLPPDYCPDCGATLRKKEG